MCCVVVYFRKPPVNRRTGPHGRQDVSPYRGFECHEPRVLRDARRGAAPGKPSRGSTGGALRAPRSEQPASAEAAEALLGGE